MYVYVSLDSVNVLRNANGKVAFPLPSPTPSSPICLISPVFSGLLNTFNMPPEIEFDFPVTSSYKNGNCLNIPTSLDSLDNIHPGK